MIWLDAMEANENGDREEALTLAEEVVSLDEDHADAWFGIAQWTLPVDSRGKQMMPDMVQSSKTMTALRRTVELAPQNEHAWRIGGEIMVGHLGMLEHGLGWWEGRKEAAPSDVLPYFEQVSILIRLGYFEEAGEYLDALDRIIESQPSKSLEARARRLRGIYEEQGSKEEELGFEPQNSKDEADHRNLLPPNVRHAHSFLAWLCSNDGDTEHPDCDVAYHRDVLRNRTPLEEASTQTEQARVVPEQGHRY